jgi:hypothetical protein
VQILGTVIGTFDAAGRSITSSQRYSTRQEKEDARLARFKTREPLDSINTDQLKQRGIDVGSAIEEAA